MKKTRKVTKLLSAGLAAIMMLFAVSAMDSVQVFAATAGTVNVSALNLRSGASTQTRVVTVLSKGATVQIESTQGDWYKVTSGSVSGYVYAKYITAGSSQTSQSGTTSSASGSVGVVNTSALNVRSGASTSTSVLGTIGLGTKVNIIGTSGSDWYQVSLTLNGSTVNAYVYKTYITLTDGQTSGNTSGSTSSDASNTSSGQTTTVSGSGVVNTEYGLNVRSSASTSSSILGCLSKGTSVTITGQTGSWYQVTVSIGGQTVNGYVSSSYITKSSTGSTSSESGSTVNTVTTSKGKVTCYGLNLRSNASTSSTVLTVLSQGTYVTIESESNGWYKVSTTANGRSLSGYVSAAYVEKVSGDAADTNSSSNSNTTAVSSDEQYLLACIVYCEAGDQSYEGMLAVANVVLNRVGDSRFPNSITEVVYQTGQFSPVTNGTLAAALANGPSDMAVKAAQDALAGNNNVEGYYFFNGYVDTSTVTGYLVIGDHTFYYY